MIKNIAVLLTCHNRKDKTIYCLHNLLKAYKTVQNSIKIKVYLTDDGSSDSTSEYVKKLYPETVILKGDGNLFWAGGMRNSWKEALKNNHDSFLLINDDTYVTENLFDELLITHNYSISHYKQSGIYIGSTRGVENSKLTYGGAIIKNKYLFSYNKLPPNGRIQECDLGNANIMLVTFDVVDKIGIIDNGYIHSVADYDYTLEANRMNIPVLILPNFCGVCDNDKINKYDLFNQLSFKKRIKYLISPTGLAFHDNLRLMKRNFLYRLPFVFSAGIIKTVLPKVYSNLNKKFRY